jgi:uncharacterized DUF497 family protein
MTYNRGVRFEWDPHKDQANQKKHGLSFDEAAALLAGESDYLEVYDHEHSDEEDRFIAIGPMRAGVVVVVYTERRDDVIRIVSARKATRGEVRLLRRYLGGTDG